MDWVSDIYRSSRGWNHLENLVDLGNRLAGSKGERKAAEFTANELSDAGLENVEIDEFKIESWSRGESEIVHRNGSSECIALPMSPSVSVSGELVDIGYGLKQDFNVDLDGKIVMVSSDVPDFQERFIHRREKYYRALDSGAVGFIYRNHIDGCLAPTGSLGSRESPIAPIPGVGVSKETGHRLKRRYSGEEVTLKVDADIGSGYSRNVRGRVGPDTDEYVLVTSHIDAHDIGEGAVDNGAGTALLVEVANTLSGLSDELGIGVEFVAFGSEEVGLRGSRHHVESIDPGDIRLVVNNDGVVRGRDLKIYTNRFPELTGLIEEVGDYLDHPVRVVPRHSPHSDHWSFVSRGVPGMYVQSYTGSRDRGWGHTSADTLDKLDIRDLREQSIFVVELVRRAASDGFVPSHKDRGEVLDELEKNGLLEELRVSRDLV